METPSTGRASTTALVHEERHDVHSRDASMLVRVETDAMKALNANMSALTKNPNWVVKG